jgi:hypothetical protein
MLGDPHDGQRNGLNRAMQIDTALVVTVYMGLWYPLARGLAAQDGCRRRRAGAGFHWRPPRLSRDVSCECRGLVSQVTRDGNRRPGEFSSETRRRLAERACYRCSFPSCGRATVGPGATPEESAATGRAAHILPASALGPRAMSDPDWSRVSSLENGIWLCANHADLIDTNAGRAFSPEILRSYKRIHEERIAREQTGISRTFPSGGFRNLRWRGGQSLPLAGA